MVRAHAIASVCVVSTSRVSHEVVCSTCGRVDADEVQARPGPGMPAERLELMAKLGARRPRQSPSSAPWA